MSHQRIVLGAIADDFTGATDLANNLVRGGMRCLQVIGVPQEALDLDDIDAVVVGPSQFRMTNFRIGLCSF